MKSKSKYSLPSSSSESSFSSFQKISVYYDSEMSQHSQRSQRSLRLFQKAKGNKNIDKGDFLKKEKKQENKIYQSVPIQKTKKCSFSRQQRKLQQKVKLTNDNFNSQNIKLKQKIIQLTSQNQNLKSLTDQVSTKYRSVSNTIVLITVFAIVTFFLIAQDPSKYKNQVDNYKKQIQNIRYSLGSINRERDNLKQQIINYNKKLADTKISLTKINDLVQLLDTRKNQKSIQLYLGRLLLHEQPAAAQFMRKQMYSNQESWSSILSYVISIGKLWSNFPRWEGHHLMINKENVHINQFTKLNWNHLGAIMWTENNFDDYDWRLFVQNAYLYRNVQALFIVSNNIRTIKRGDLQSFKELSSISFEINPLTQSSKTVILEYLSKNPKVRYISDGQ